MKAFGLTIARKGSVRLPGKNMKMLCGKPLLEWTLLQLVNTKLIGKYWLVTDWEEAARLAESYGFGIVWQPQEEIELAEAKGKMGGPYAYRRGMEAAQHWVTQVDEIGNRAPFDVMIPILPTMPLRKPEDLDRAIEMWLGNQELPVVSAVNYKDMVMYELRDGVAHPVLFDKSHRLWELHGNIWVGTPKQYIDCSFHPNGEPFTFEETPQHVKYFPYPMEFWQRYDIDYQEDFDTVEYWLEAKILKGKGFRVYTDYKEYALSEYGFEQHAADYNKGVEQNLIPAEMRNSFFNHFPVVMETLKTTPPEVKGWELVEIYDDGKGLRRRPIKHIIAHNGSDVFAEGNVLKEQKPALVIGSGPSLDKAAPLMKNWDGGIFCSTSQASTLIHHGTEPTHMVAYDINTNPKEFEWADTWKGRRTVLVTHPGMHPATIERWPNKKIYFRSMDTGNFFFTNVLPLAYGDVIPSHMFLFSCSIAAQMSLAHAMNYHPLYFVGCDYLADRFTKWWYDQEKKEWICDPAKQGIWNHKMVKSANGRMTDPLQVFYKRSTLCVWRIDHSQVIQTSDMGILPELPYIPIEEVIEKNGSGLEDRYFTNEQIDDASEMYLARFNQFVLRFEHDEKGRQSYRVLESHARENWEADVRRYMEALKEGLKQQKLPTQLDVDKNMERFKWLKERIRAADSNQQ